MSSTQRRPGPAAYIGLGLLIAIAFTPLGIRVIAYGTSLGHPVNLTLFAAGSVLMCGAGAYGAYLIVRYFRAARVEDRADREAEAAKLRAEIKRQRAEVDKLYQRMEEVEGKSWWTDPKTAPTEEDTVELGPNVYPFRRPGGWTDRRSS